MNSEYVYYMGLLFGLIYSVSFIRGFYVNNKIIRQRNDYGTKR